MPSIIPGYDYDVFISYRQKDNKYDGWVTEFVANLKKEIEATFKEELSIYYDVNPQDALLETQHVNKSLEGKLKCLIFIPILSQTYCDPDCYAWKHEFCAFKKMAEEDAFGLYIRLANGNVESRILPVRIHELDPQDHALIEKELGGTLRSLSFIYRTPGVNRPLRAHEDEPKENLNHIFYRDQINKVANTIKRTIAGMRMKGVDGEKITLNSSESQPVESKPKSRLTWIGLGVAALIVTLAAWYYFGQPRHQPSLEPSVAVLPFVDMSASGDQEYFSDGLSEELLNLLARIPELKVISRTSAFSFKGKNEDVRSIGEKLGVAHILEGSVRKSENKLRITAQLIRVSDGSHMWSKTFDRDLADIFKIQDEISQAVVSELRLTLLGNPATAGTSNSESYNAYLLGKYFFTRRTKEDVEKAVAHFEQAIQLDNANASAWAALSLALANQANNGFIDSEQGFQKAREAAEQAIRTNPQSAQGYYALASILASYDWNWKEANTQFTKALELDPANVGALNGMANLQLTLGHFDEALKLYSKALDLDPLRPVIKLNLGMTYMHAGKPAEAVAALQKVLELNNNFPSVHYRLALCHLLLNQPELALSELDQETTADWKLHGQAIVYSKLAPAKADSILNIYIKEHESSSAFQIAEVYGYRNEKQKAFEWLEKAYANRDGGLTSLAGNPWLNSLVAEPEYRALVAKMGLE